MKTKAVNRNIWYYLLGMFGLQSCVSFGGTEYGCPHATFNLNGVVKSAQTELPVPDIKVIMKKYIEDSDTSLYVNIDSALTNAEGRFSLSVSDFPDDHEFMLHLIDVDGETNGRFAAKDTSIVFADNEYTGGESWYAGETTKEIEVKLESENE